MAYKFSPGYTVCRLHKYVHGILIIIISSTLSIQYDFHCMYHTNTVKPSQLIKGSLQLSRWISSTAQNQRPCPGRKGVNFNASPPSKLRYCCLLAEAEVTNMPLTLIDVLMLELHSQSWRCCPSSSLCPWQQSGWTTLHQPYPVLFGQEQCDTSHAKSQRNVVLTLLNRLRIIH